MDKIAQIREISETKKPATIDNVPLDCMAARMILKHREKLAPEKIAKFDRYQVSKMLDIACRGK